MTGKGRSWKTGLLVLVVAVLARGGTVRADEESDRRRLIDAIDDQLEEAADELRDLPSASDARPVDSARSYVDKAERLVGELKEVRGSDSTAEDIVDDYPGYVREFRAVAPELAKLKDRQGDAKELARQCKAFDDSMRQRARDTKDGPGKADELSAFAKSVGRQGEDVMNAGERQRSELERLADTVSRFSPDHREWRRVRDALRGGATSVLESWRRDLDQAKRDCEDVVKRERHPEIEKALGRLASSTEGRAALRKRVDELLGQIADKVGGDAGSVHVAVELTREVESQLERLRAAQGDDDEAARVAAEWPASVRELRTSLEAVRELKTRQTKADDGASNCQTASGALQDKLTGYLGAVERHKESIRTLPAEAAALGALWDGKIKAATEADKQMADWLKVAHTFRRSDGRWSDVQSKLGASATGAFNHWHGKYEAAVDACKLLVLGAEHPDVKKTLDEMQRDTTAASTSYRALRAEFNLWYAQVEQLRDWSAQDVEEIRQAFCKAPDAGEYAEVYAVAERWASNLETLYGTVRGGGERIKQSADALIAKKRAKINAPKTKAAVDTVLTSLEKIKTHQLAGSNNPLLKAQATYGQDEHARRQSGCDAKEVEVPGDYCDNPNPNRHDCKIDCVRGCTVWEIKPDGARALGEKQAKAYVDGLVEMFADNGVSMFTGNLAVFKGCVADDGRSLKVTFKVEPYDFCPKPDQIAPPISVPTAQLPEEEE